MNALIAFQNIVLIDGTGGKPLFNATVGVRSGTIIYAGPAKKWQPSLDEDIINLDFNGKYLLPGLIDCHVRLSKNSGTGIRSSDGGRALMVLNHARHHLSAGFTTIRDFSERNDVTFAVRRAVRDTKFSGPRILLSEPLFLNPDSNTTDHEEIRRAVRECLDGNADLIEWCSTGNVDFCSETACIVVQEAANLGKRVAVSALDVNEIREAVKAGAHTIEHGAFLHQARNVLVQMAQRGTVLISTLKADRDSPRRKSVRRQRAACTRPTQADSLKSLQMAHEVGVSIAMGSGAGTSTSNMHGENATEIHRMAQAGLPPMDALVASTSGAARALGLQSRLGSVEVGKKADLLVLDENPLDDLGRLADKKQIRAVFLDGKLVARQLADSYPKTIFARDCLTVGE